MGILLGIIFDKFGLVVIILLGFCVLVGGYLLLWSIIFYINFYKNISLLMGLYFMICGKYIYKKNYKKYIIIYNWVI